MPTALQLDRLCLVSSSHALRYSVRHRHVLCGAFLICVLFSTRREVRRFATSEKAEKHADQFLWSCIFFSMLSFSFGIAVTTLILYSADFTRTVGAVWFGALTCVGIYPVLRDAKRLADAVEPDQSHFRPNGCGQQMRECCNGCTLG